jgi:hypothetical protein
MQRTTIVVSTTLNPGEVANATAIVMGQLARRYPELYGMIHAAISYNVIILRARPAQMTKFVKAIRNTPLIHCVFGNAGRKLSNNFDEYAKLVESSTSEELQIIAVGITGDDESIRSVSLGLSVYNPERAA